jgi:hypothetical protein
MIVEIAKIIGRAGSIPLFDTEKRREHALNLRQEQLVLLQNLTLAGIDPRLFDLMLTTELDRNLKKQFGVAFLVTTVVFALLSYGVIVINSVLSTGLTWTRTRGRLRQAHHDAPTGPAHVSDPLPYPKRRRMRTRTTRTNELIYDVLK